MDELNKTSYSVIVTFADGHETVIQPPTPRFGTAYGAFDAMMLTLKMHGGLMAGQKVKKVRFEALFNGSPDEH